MNALVVGLGNIGLHVADHVARMKDVQSIALVDPDNFTAENIFGQPISPSAVNAAKVDVAAVRISEINPALKIERWKCRVECLPRGLFRNRLIISALDTRFARSALSQICFAMGCNIWFDLGVRANQRIARVSTVFPADPHAACLCCGWSDKDWSALLAEFSCDGVVKGAPTRAPAYLGAAAAAMAAELVERCLAGTLARRAEVQHYFASLTLQKSWITHVTKNGACRSSHELWTISGCMPNGAALENGTVSVPGLPFVRRLRCSCGAEKRILFIAARLNAERLRCDLCGDAMRYGAFDLADQIDLCDLEDFGQEISALPLADIGITDRDIVRVGDHYFEVGDSARSG